MNFSQRIPVLILTLLLLSCSLSAQVQWSTDYAYYGSGGKLTYTPDEEGNVIPDFSHVGYMYGDVDIPDIPVVAEVSPVDGDDGASIQAAIESLYSLSPDENGFRGAVLLKAGTYEISGQLTIMQSGIVLRGEGQGDDGTVLIAAGTSDRTLIVAGGSATLSVNSSSKVTVTEDFVPLGRKFVIVSNASGFSEGDLIAVYRPGTEEWISDIKMDQISDYIDGTPSTQWTPSTYSFYFERTITRISGDTLFFRNPLVMALDKNYGGGYVYKVSFNRLEKIGVENLCMKSEYASETDEAHSWTAVQFRNVENGWARDLSSWYFAYACVFVGREAKFISVLDCGCFEPKSIITGERRYSFYCEGQMNLFKDCRTTEGRHDFVTGSRVCGPNVFTGGNSSTAYNDIGPHHRWAMGSLYDYINTDGEINVQDRDNMGSGHGWAGANQVFWNCTGASSICQSPWASAKNYNFGFIGEKDPGYRPDRPDGVWEGHNRTGLFPASLYNAQLDERLNGTVVFSALTELVAVTDSSFRMSFNLPVEAADIIAANFTVSGTAGLENQPFTLTLENENTVRIDFEDPGILPSLSTIILTAKVRSAEGLSLTGLNSSFYTEPDKRPVVSGPGLTVNNEEGSFVVAKSTKTGTAYIIRMGEELSSVEAFENAVSIYKGAKATISVPDVSVPIYTKGLYGGFYYLFAVDEDGRISAAGNELINILETGPVNGIPSGLSSSFLIYSYGNRLFIQPDTDETYSLAIYDLNGRLLHLQSALSGSRELSLDQPSGIMIVKIKTQQETRFYKIPYLAY